MCKRVEGYHDAQVIAHEQCFFYQIAELIDKATLGYDDHLLCELQENTEEEVSVFATRSKNVPTWSSYNSVLNHSQPSTKISMLPLTVAPLH